MTKTARLAVAALAGALTACSASRNGGPDLGVPVAPTVVVTEAELSGNWGLASYRNEEDRSRTEAEAKTACGSPYQIVRGPNGGAMMYLADQSELSELFVKGDAQGRTFIGPEGPAGVRQDRVVTSYEEDVMITEWVDPDARERYGTMLFVRCDSA